MSREEKLKLKDEISNSVPKGVLELLGDRVIDEALDAEGCDHALGDIVEEGEEYHNDVIRRNSDEKGSSAISHATAHDDELFDVRKSSVPDAELSLVIPDVGETPDAAVSEICQNVSADDRVKEVVIDEATSLQKRPPVPLPRTMTPQKLGQADEKAGAFELKPTPSKLGSGAKSCLQKRRYFKTPEALKPPSYMKPTTASQQRSSPSRGDSRYF